jgi:hypothetical protein
MPLILSPNNLTLRYIETYFFGEDGERSRRPILGRSTQHIFLVGKIRDTKLNIFLGGENGDLGD